MFCTNCGHKLKNKIVICPSCGFENSNPTVYTRIIPIQTFIIYTIITFGIYELVWIYRVWKYIKIKENSNISPFFRTLFTIFYIFSLYKKIKIYSKEQGYVDDFSPGFRAFGWIVTSLIVSSEEVTGVLPIYVSFIFSLKPLDALNYYFSKTEVNSKERSTEWWHLVLLGICLLLWISIISTLVNPAIFN